MTKNDLILLTIRQLKDSYNMMPECLSLEDPEVISGTQYPYPAIIWRHMVELDGKLIQDPNNAARTIIVSYNKVAQQMTASIYFRDVPTFNTSIMPDATISFKYKYWPYFYKSFRLFMQLRTKLLEGRQNKQNIDYVRKLIAIFPSTGDDDLIG